MEAESILPIRWKNNALQLLDQRCLPSRETYLRLTTAPQVTNAIAELVVRGAPAIGISAAYGVVLSIQQHAPAGETDGLESVRQDIESLRAARPTAVNLGWALDRMTAVLTSAPDQLLESARQLAGSIHQQDIAANRKLGDLGATYLAPASQVLTHCNAGALATGGYGTALGVIRSGWRDGLIKQVYAAETRPWLQGARLTAWELQHDHIPTALIVDGATAWLFRRQSIDWLIVGADRVAANGDVANKIGTYHAALAARHHGARVMVAIPTSTLDMKARSGADIPIENRSIDEITHLAGHPVAAADVPAWNPVFDITPAALVDVLVTEKGALEQPDRAKIEALMAS